MKKRTFKILVIILLCILGIKIFLRFYNITEKADNPIDPIIMFRADEGFEEQFFAFETTEEIPPPSPEAPGENQFPVKEITVNPQSSKGYLSFGNILISNMSDKELDIEALLSAGVKTRFTDSEKPQILIIHTHTTESYGDGKGYYTKGDSERSRDQNVNIVKVGSEMADEFKRLGINVIHAADVFDYPEFPGSYDRSIKVIKSYMEKYPSITSVIDIHRDSMTSDSGVKYRPVTEISGEKCAQVMIVSGTNQMLKNDYYRDNLKFTLKIQKKMQDKFPALARPLNLRAQRFNSHASPGSFLLEVGSAGNTLDQAVRAARYSAQCIYEVICENKG